MLCQKMSHGVVIIDMFPNQQPTVTIVVTNKHKARRKVKLGISQFDISLDLKTPMTGLSDLAIVQLKHVVQVAQL